MRHREPDVWADFLPSLVGVAKFRHQVLVIGRRVLFATRFQLARSVLLGQSLLCPPGTPPFSECLGLLALNPDRSIKRKFERTWGAKTAAFPGRVEVEA